MKWTVQPITEQFNCIVWTLWPNPKYGGNMARKREWRGRKKNTQWIQWMGESLDRTETGEFEQSTRKEWERDWRCEFSFKIHAHLVLFSSFSVHLPIHPFLLPSPKITIFGHSALITTCTSRSVVISRGSTNFLNGQFRWIRMGKRRRKGREVGWRERGSWEGGWCWRRRRASWSWTTTLVEKQGTIYKNISNFSVELNPELRKHGDTGEPGELNFDLAHRTFELSSLDQLLRSHQQQQLRRPLMLESLDQSTLQKDSFMRMFRVRILRLYLAVVNH